MKLIVGLGNLGNEYRFMRYNVGFLVIDKICEKLNILLNKEKFNGEFVVFDGFILVKLFIYMNKLGDFVYLIVSFYKINFFDIIVIYDDFSFFIG